MRENVMRVVVVGVVVVAIVAMLVGWVISADAGPPVAGARSARACTCQTGVIVLFDVTGSIQPAFDQARTEVEGFLGRTQAGMCVSVLLVTEKSREWPEFAVDNHCIAAPRYKHQGTNPSVKELVATWRERAATLAPTRPRTDTIGAFWQAGKWLSRADMVSRIVVSVGDARQNVGLDLDRPDEIDVAKSLAHVRAEGMFAQLKGAQVSFLGVNTLGKRNARFFNSQETFWRDYVKASGGAVITFSPQYVWNGTLAAAATAR